jgi:hypothetical protein
MAPATAAATRSAAATTRSAAAAATRSAAAATRSAAAGACGAGHSTNSAATTRSAAARSAAGSGSSERGRVPRLLAEKRQKDWRQARGRPPVRTPSWLKVARRDTPMRLILRFSGSPSCNLCWSDP